MGREEIQSPEELMAHRVGRFKGVNMRRGDLVSVTGRTFTRVAPGGDSE